MLQEDATTAAVTLQAVTSQAHTMPEDMQYQALHVMDGSVGQPVVC